MAELLNQHNMQALAGQREPRPQVRLPNLRDLHVTLLLSAGAPSTWSSADRATQTQDRASEAADVVLERVVSAVLA